MAPLLCAALFLSAPQGLGGLGSPSQATPKVLRFEADVLRGINRVRKKKGKEPLVMDEKLRAFAREQAELAATGDPAVKYLDAKLENLKLAPHGHAVQHAYGKSVKEAVQRALGSPSLLEPYQRAGIGAFWVPEKPPYFQFTVILARDPDPNAGKPGLSQNQTDPVMNKAAKQIERDCYSKVIKDDPNRRGDTLFKLIIGGKGTVTEVTQVKAFGHEGFDQCAVAIIKKLRFDEPYKNKPVTLMHPMRFVPRQGDKRVGRLRDGQINNAIGVAKQDFRHCYDQRQKKRKTLAGSVMLALTVQPDGHAKNVRLEEDKIGDGPLRKCILKRAKRLQFPRPEFEGEVEVRYPLRFSPPKDG